MVVGFIHWFFLSTFIISGEILKWEFGGALFRLEIVIWFDEIFFNILTSFFKHFLKHWVNWSVLQLWPTVTWWVFLWVLLFFVNFFLLFFNKIYNLNKYYFRRQPDPFVVILHGTFCMSTQQIMSQISLFNILCT